MWYASVVTTAAATLPVSLAMVKQRCRVDTNDEDELLGDLIDEVTAHAERYCNLRIMPQTVAAKCDGFRDFHRLPDGPLSEESGPIISYTDVDGAEQTVDPEIYELRVDGLEASIVLRFGKSWPAIRFGSRITMEVEAGYGDVPYDIRTAILFRIAQLYEHRENSPAPDWTEFDALLCNYRRGV